MLQLTTVCAAVASSRRPTSVEPVKDSLRTRGSSTIAPTTAPALRVVRQLTTPGGTPASSSSATMASAVRGVSVAGLRTTVQPAASAGPILRVAIAAGKFHGVTRTATPIGCRSTRILLVPAGGAPAPPPAGPAAPAEPPEKPPAAGPA